MLAALQSGVLWCSAFIQGGCVPEGMWGVTGADGGAGKVTLVRFVS